MGDWWKGLSVWEQVAVMGATGLGLGGLVGFVVDRPRRKKLPPGGFSPWAELPDLIDYDSDEVDESEPPGLEYDDRDAPCVRPPYPWDVPVAAGLEGDPDAEGCISPSDLAPKKKTEAVFTAGSERPRWPLDTEQNRKIRVSYQDVRGKWHGRWGREFGASRKRKGGGKRVHVGIDLFADPGDVVVAMEDGEVLAALPFYKGTGALYLLTDSGHIINYGELERGSWRDYDVTGEIDGGQRVKAGDAIGRVGLSTDGSHMLHLETYDPDITLDSIRQGHMQWSKGDAPPEGIRDPTEYLVRAQRVKLESMVEES